MVGNGDPNRGSWQRDTLVILGNGKNFRARNADLIALIFDGYNMSFIALSSALILYLYPGDHLGHLVPWERNFIISLGIVLFWTTLFTLLSLVISLPKIGVSVTVFVPLFVLISTILTEVLTRKIGSLVVDKIPPIDDEGMKAAFINYIFVLVFEIMHATFVIPMTCIGKMIGRVSDPSGAAQTEQAAPVEPVIVNSLDAMPHAFAADQDFAHRFVEPNVGHADGLSATADAATATVLIRDQPYSYEDLLYLKSEDHYVRIVTATTSTLRRARFADVIKEVSAIHGMQVHRSFWVSFASISEWYSLPEGGLMLVMKNGDRVPVSRSRKKEFQTMQ
jgi:hypothetical protein